MRSLPQFSTNSAPRPGRRNRLLTSRGQAFRHDYLASRLPSRSFCPIRKCASVLVLAPPEDQRTSLKASSLAQGRGVAALCWYDATARSSLPVAGQAIGGRGSGAGSRLDGAVERFSHFLHNAVLHARHLVQEGVPQGPVVRNVHVHQLAPEPRRRLDAATERHALESG